MFPVDMLALLNIHTLDPGGSYQGADQNLPYVGPGGGGTQTRRIIGHHSDLAVHNVQGSGGMLTISHD
jgi:hypothetical protein